MSSSKKRQRWMGSLSSNTMTSVNAPTIAMRDSRTNPACMPEAGSGSCPLMSTMKWPTSPTTTNISSSVVNILSEWRLGLAMLHVIQSATIEVGDVIVVEAIEHLPALFARAD